MYEKWRSARKRSFHIAFNEELFRAIERGSLRDVQVCLKKRGAISSIFEDKFPYGTVMHVAAYYGHRDLLAFFLNKERGINSTDRDLRNTPLHLASLAGHAEVVEFLLDQNANIHAVNWVSRKPIHKAAKAGQKDVVQIFLEKGMDVKETDGFGATLLHLSCLKGNLKLVEFLVNYKADIHAKDEDGRKPILVAAAYGQKDVVEYFLDLGMSVEETDQNGQTALHFAAKDHHLEVVQLLVDRIGAKPQLDAQDNKGKTPLHLVTRCETDVRNCLLDAGARSDIKDHDGRTALFYFMNSDVWSHYCDHQSVLAKIHHNFVDIDDQTKLTAAHLVAKHACNTIDYIPLVLQNQKDLNTEDKNGNTPMNYIIGNLSVSSIDRQETLIRMFVDHGASFKVEDCERIIQNRSLKEKLFTDKKFCSQCLVNKFDNRDLPMLGRLPSAMSFSVLEKLKLRSNQIGLIESAVEEEIRNEGHCDFSKMMAPLLSILAIESYISHYNS